MRLACGVVCALDIFFQIGQKTTAQLSGIILSGGKNSVGITISSKAPQKFIFS
jgi:hypothetical protein